MYVSVGCCVTVYVCICVCLHYKHKQAHRKIYSSNMLNLYFFSRSVNISVLQNIRAIVFIFIVMFTTFRTS